MRAFAFAAIFGGLLTTSAIATPAYVVFNIDSSGAAAVESLTAQLDRAGASVIVEADDTLAALVETDRLPATVAAQARQLSIPADTRRLFLIREAHQDTVQRLESDIIARGGRLALVKAKTAYLESIRHSSVVPIDASGKVRLVLARQAANQPSFKDIIAFPDGTDDLVRAVDGKRWRAHLQALVGFNRFSHGTGITGARDYLVEAFSAIPGLQVSTDAFRLGSSTVHNVMARLPGASRPDDVIIVGAHYDSISQSPQTTAPGAEDNGSGTAGLLELARILATTRPAATILFIAYAGEEQGLNGSYDHVRKLRAAGQLATIKAVFNMDMIAYTADADFDCLLESDSRGSQTIFPSLLAAAEQFTSLRMVTSLNPWGSDHVPYIEAGIPALLTIDNDWDDYPAYHRTTDTLEKTSMPLAAEILKMQIAAIWQWAH